VPTFACVLLKVARCALPTLHIYITGQILAVDGGFDAAGIGLPTLRGQRRNS
jgi:hypothetical protein